MSNPAPPDQPFTQLTDRVERLLLRHAELQRTNELLTRQVEDLRAERDMLQQRLATARARVETLLARLDPSTLAQAFPAQTAPTSTPATSP
jgi:ABC-type phosphate transport system auxiliary subunit